MRAVTDYPAVGTDLAGVAYAGKQQLRLGGAGALGVRVIALPSTQQVSSRDAVTIVAVEPFADVAYREGSNVEANFRWGRSMFVSSSGTAMPSPTPGSPSYYRSDSGLTGRVFVNGNRDEEAIPGLYIYTLNYRGVLDNPHDTESVDLQSGIRSVTRVSVSTSASFPYQATGTPIYYGGDTGATARVFVHGVKDTKAYPGLYRYVLTYAGVIGRSDTSL
jgi:hypothetical protein